MISIDLGESDLVGLVKSLQTEDIALVEVTLGEWDKVHVVIEGLEPFTLLGVNHGVLAEHHQEESVHGGELLLLDRLNGGITLLVVDVWEEDTVGQVLGVVLWVSEISSWSKMVLNDWKIDQVAGNLIHDVADESIEALWDSINSEVWSTN